MTDAAVEIQPAGRVAANPLSRSTGWWAMVLVIATEATLFVLLAAVYFYLRVETPGTWPPPPHVDPRILRPLIATLILVVGTIPMVVAARSARVGRPDRTQLGLIAALAFGVAFLAFQAVLVHDSLALFRPQDDAYSSIYYTLIGVHYVHAVVGVLLTGWTLARARGFTPARHLTLQVAALYWYFVNAAAVLVFLVLYLAPRG